MPLFLYSSFQHLTVKLFIIKFCLLLDLNRGPMVTEATTLPILRGIFCYIIGRGEAPIRVHMKHALDG